MGRARSRAGKKPPHQRTGTSAVASARSNRSDLTKIIIWILIVLLVAGAVVGGVLFTNAQKNRTEGVVIQPNAPASGATASYPVRRDGAVVVAGKDTAKVTIDVYEDFLCPFCRMFELDNAEDIDRELTAGNLQVRYHLLAILNNRSDPPGYSLDAANAALCVADADHFPEYHLSLYKAQPEEGARGYDKAQLTRLGTDLGVTSPAFPTCIQSNQHTQQLQAEQTKVTADPALQQDLGNGQKSFGTPTITSGQTIINTSDPAWLDNLLTP